MDLTYEAIFVAKIVLSMIVGFIIGLDRELLERPAGIRTHMLVAGASCSMVLVGQGLVDFYSTMAQPEWLRTDPLRIIEAIITGISFVGAGTIIRRPQENAIEGLTTAASMMFTAATGIMVAQGLYFLAICSGLLVLFVMRGMRPIKNLLGRWSSPGEG